MVAGDYTVRFGDVTFDDSEGLSPANDAQRAVDVAPRGLTQRRQPMSSRDARR